MTVGAGDKSGDKSGDKLPGQTRTGQHQTDVGTGPEATRRTGSHLLDGEGETLNPQVQGSTPWGRTTESLVDRSFSPVHRS